MSARRRPRPAYARPHRPRKRRNPDDIYNLFRSGRHIAFRWHRFTRAIGDLCVGLGGAVSKRIGLDGDRSRPRRASDSKDDEDPPKSSIWPKLIWHTILIAVPVALYLWLGPVHRVVDATAGAAYNAIPEEIYSPLSDGAAPDPDESDDGTSIIIRLPRWSLCWHAPA